MTFVLVIMVIDILTWCECVKKILWMLYWSLVLEIFTCDNGFDNLARFTILVLMVYLSPNNRDFYRMCIWHWSWLRIFSLKKSIWILGGTSSTKILTIFSSRSWKESRHRRLKISEKVHCTRTVLALPPPRPQNLSIMLVIKTTKYIFDIIYTVEWLY